MKAKDDSIRYIHNDIGYNYRLSNVLAALGLAQLEQLDDFIELLQLRFQKDIDFHNQQDELQ